MALTLSGTNGIVGAGFTLDPSGTSVTSGIGTFSKIAVGANNVNPTQALEVKGSSSVAIQVESSAAQYSEVQINNSTKNYTLGVRPDISHGFAIRDASAGTNRLTIDTSGNATVNSGNLVIGTAGKGIDFSNATDEAGGESSTESILYDYEAGSFEPVLSTSGGSSSFSGDATYNGGYYVRIGRMVHISMNVRGTFTLGSGSGAVYITGLPFTAGATEELTGCGNAPYAFIGIPYHSGLVPSSGYTIGGGMVIPNSTAINIYQKIVSQASNPTVNPATNVSTSSGGVNIHCSGCYLAT